MVSKKYPFSPYPIGWFQVAYCDEIEIGSVVPLKYFGEDLVAFRGENGEVKVLMLLPSFRSSPGARRQSEGQLFECPFHAWKFDGDGKCIDVPVPKKILKQKLTLHAVVGQVMVWDHPNGGEPYGSCRILKKLIR